nr:l-type lectin-domain containing receptor kinase vi.2 [Quercus suber]
MKFSFGGLVTLTKSIDDGVKFGANFVSNFKTRGVDRKDEEDDHALDDDFDEDFEKGTGPKKFSYDELAHVTNDFNDKEKLGRTSMESDVYSFGIIALEIACRRKPIDHGAPEDQVVMLEWVRELHGRGEVLEAVDRRLGGN